MQNKLNVSSIFVQKRCPFSLRKEWLSIRKRLIPEACGIGAVLIFTKMQSGILYQEMIFELDLQLGEFGAIPLLMKCPSCLRHQKH